MRRGGVHRLTVGVLVALSSVAVGLSLVAHNVIRDQERRLLTERAGEIGAVLTNSYSGVAATMRSLGTVAATGANPQKPFVDTATPLVVGQTRAIMLIRRDANSLSRVAMVGDGVPAGPLTGDRLDVVRRAMSEPGLVSGLITDGLRRRVGFALGPEVGAQGWVIYQESAIDPFSPDARTASTPFSELNVALYSASTAREDRLVLATTRQVPITGNTSTALVPVGVDDWLVVVGSQQPLVGSFATRVPWLLLAGGLVSALLAAMVVETLGRRRDFALALVDERTTSLRESLRDLQAAQEELVRNALHDGLTKLPNRTLFLNRVEQALNRSRRDGSTVAVMFLDVDRFKWVNDSLGHVAGDRLLVAVAGTLARAVRPGDTVARLGGDEFVVLCENVDDGEAQAIAHRLRDSVMCSPAFEGHELRPTVSIGLTLSNGRTAGIDAEAMVRDADLAMYKAKDRGRDRVELFDERLRQHAASQLESEIALRRAVEQGEFEVYYQPVVDLPSQEVSGVEALVRWNHPSRGVVLPGEFIPMAEDTGLVCAIGAFVLEEACGTVQGWQQANPDLPPLTVSVNLSARQLDLVDLAASVTGILDRTGLDPSRLWLEITETTLMHDVPATLDALQSLRALGVTLVVDDFGTGYSSLLYLRRYPVDVLKVDQSFVRGLGNSPADTAIVLGVVRLAQALGMSAVAEGVENPEQADQLAAMGCEMAQGFHWSPARPADEALRWILERPGPEPLAGPINDPSPLRVLLVDDHAAARDLVRLTLLVEGGFEIVGEAADGVEAISLAAAHQPDLVVLDVMMPVLDGAHALPGILAVAPHTKVIVLTALEPAAKPADAFASASGFFDKTTDLTQLIAKIPEMLGRTRSAR